MRIVTLLLSVAALSAASAPLAAQTTDEFWQLIESTRSEDCDAHAERLTRRLAALPPPRIVAFSRELELRLDDAYRWDLWGVAYLVNGGSSDDGFEYFRGWLIAQGRSYFEAALRDPQRAADRARAGEAECEALLHVAHSAYEAATGRALPDSETTMDMVPKGREWTEEDLPELFPEVARRFGH